MSLLDFRRLLENKLFRRRWTYFYQLRMIFVGLEETKLRRITVQAGKGMVLLYPSFSFSFSLSFLCLFCTVRFFIMFGQVL